jgi:Pretoxin HINT domain
VATDSHPFWVENLNAWVYARDLRPGMWLRTSAGTYVQIGAVEATTRHHQRVHNLTVEGPHTYHVVAAAGTSLLVHNAGCRPRFEVDSKGVANDLTGPQDLVLINQRAGDGFRDDIAAFLRSQGKRVITDAEDRALLTFKVPNPKNPKKMDTRVLDMRVEDANGNLLGYVETKWGGAGARYAGSKQARQDDWLRQNLGLTIDIVRGGG